VLDVPERLLAIADEVKITFSTVSTHCGHRPDPDPALQQRTPNCSSD
jgi:hypothetical protein